jgi:hypothetical protein
MPFIVKAYVDDHVLTAYVETAQKAFAKAVEWQVADQLTDVSISDGTDNYSVDEFSLLISKLSQN